MDLINLPTFHPITAADVTNPVIQNCPSDITRSLPATSTGTTVTWQEPTATDDSGIQPNVMRSHAPGLFFPLGTTRVTYTFTDLSGNSAVCSFDVIVIGMYKKWQYFTPGNFEKCCPILFYHLF